MKNRIWAIIPARSGSRGLKDKNIKILNKTPLIGHAIKFAIKTNIFDIEDAVHICVVGNSHQDVYTKLMGEYQNNFFSDTQQGGKDRIMKTCLKHEPSSTYSWEIVP